MLTQIIFKMSRFPSIKHLWPSGEQTLPSELGVALRRVASALKIALIVGGGLASLNAAIRLPAIFGDHMVVQRSRPVAVWGWADLGETVTVALAGQSATAEAGPDGKWQARLGPLVASGTAQDMTVTGTSRIVLHDVLIGDVWVCSGQSNMELQLNRTYGARNEIPQARQPGVRLFKVPNVIRLEPEDDCRGK